MAAIEGTPTPTFPNDNDGATLNPVPTFAQPSQTQDRPPDTMSVPTSLYFITLGIALSLMVGISTVLLVRTTLLRARLRRLHAVSAMRAAARGQALVSSKPPILWDVYSPPHASLIVPVTWSHLQPLSFGQLATQRTKAASPSAPAPPPPSTMFERMLNLPPLPPGAESFIPLHERGLWSGGSRDRTTSASLRTTLIRAWRYGEAHAHAAYTGGDVEREYARRNPPTAVSAADTQSPAQAQNSQLSFDEEQLDRPSRIGFLLSMPRGELLLGTHDHDADLEHSKSTVASTVSFPSR
ncbi:hypothetical protein BKA62DRAFT_716206 [Auriculariales sp. MPI-PUGE-AT-0066]|nr:hypothetical protein BKA62DRAFT_716206 [Auriculariales sp. MPI-PUGE-AT-0066]